MGNRRSIQRNNDIKGNFFVICGSATSLFSATMQKMFLTVLCILLFTGNILQLESCKYNVAILQEENLSCFSKMKEETPCNNVHPSCITEERHGLTCIKWSDVALTCVDNDLNKVPIEKQACAQDQESLNCTREFLNSEPTKSVVNKASAVSIYCGGGYILLLVIIITFFNNASCFICGTN